jgi:hypothetical protein
MVVGNAGPNVAAVILNMPPDAPRRELIRIASCGGNVGGADVIAP